MRRPALIRELSDELGSQAVVVAIDAKRQGDGWTVFTRGGRTDEGIDAIEWARQSVSLGCGEILLTSMDTDGVKQGFDCEMVRAMSSAVSVPVIASGGAGQPQDFVDVFAEGERRRRARCIHFSLRHVQYSRSEGFAPRSWNTREAFLVMIFPCIDLIGGSAVQLVQGKKKALDAGDPLALVGNLTAFPASGHRSRCRHGPGSNDDLVAEIARRKRIRVGGGVRTIVRARELIDIGLEKIIVGTAAFT